MDAKAEGMGFYTPPAVVIKIFIDACNSNLDFIYSATCI